VRLSRFNVLVANEGLSAKLSLGVTRTTIIFPIGRGPGRPPLDPEFDALVEAAKVYAQQYEDGVSLEGHPQWQHVTDINQVPGAPAMVYVGPERKRFACERCGATVFTRTGEVFTCNGCGCSYAGEGPDLDEPGPHAHTRSGPADCRRCQLLRDNPWVAQ
jgi:hypothetical protein